MSPISSRAFVKGTSTTSSLLHSRCMTVVILSSRLRMRCLAHRETGPISTKATNADAMTHKIKSFEAFDSRLTSRSTVRICSADPHCRSRGQPAVESFKRFDLVGHRIRIGCFRTDRTGLPVGQTSHSQPARQNHNGHASTVQPVSYTHLRA